MSVLAMVIASGTARYRGQQLRLFEIFSFVSFKLSAAASHSELVPLSRFMQQTTSWCKVGKGSLPTEDNGGKPYDIRR